MKFVDEFRDPEAAARLSAKIRRTAEGTDRLRLMEVCGGHTMAIHRFGIPDLLPENVELLSGPGCPVCVTPTTYVDRALELAEQEDTVVATFGDLYRVTGRADSLEDAAARGSDVRVVYSPRDALAMAREEPGRRVIFLAVGFETTAPGVAATVLGAAREGMDNFSVLVGHKLMPPALEALMEAPKVDIQGFLLPGHVSTITGPEPYSFLPERYGVACCVTGFEPTDILRGILSLVRQLSSGSPTVDNAYPRAVRAGGNPAARRLLERVFERVDCQWRGLGLIAESGLDLRPELAAHRAEPPDPALPSAEHERCRCPEVLRGLIRPTDCALFGGVCVPDSPTGPCMVSSEGACAAFYRYGGGHE